MSPAPGNKGEPSGFSHLVEQYKKELMGYAAPAAPVPPPPPEGPKHTGPAPAPAPARPMPPPPGPMSGRPEAPTHTMPGGPILPRPESDAADPLSRPESDAADPLPRPESDAADPLPRPEHRPMPLPSEGPAPGRPEPPPRPMPPGMPKPHPFRTHSWRDIRPEEPAFGPGSCVGPGCGIVTKPEARILAAREQTREERGRTAPTASPSGPEQVDRRGREPGDTNQRWQEGPGQVDWKGPPVRVRPPAFPPPERPEEIDRRRPPLMTEPPIGWQRRPGSEELAMPVSRTAPGLQKVKHTEPERQMPSPCPDCPEMPEKKPPMGAAAHLHPFPMERFTDSQGAPVEEDQHSLTVGPNGPTLLADSYLVEKLAHFDRERIPERVVHAKGAGALGTFVSYGTAAPFTKADFLQKKGEKTPVLVRFSTVIGGRSSADTVRDPRGFATKFYTREGNYDLVGNSLPVFFIRDAIQFPDLIHSLKPDPVSNLSRPERFWDFVSHKPEATHMLTWLYSDRGTLGSYRYMDGFGVNTYRLLDREGHFRLVKFHWVSQQGIRTLTRQQAQELAGKDPDTAVRDLREAIDRGELPRYELCLQIMEPEQAEELEFDPLDDTKTWDTQRFPLLPVGMMTLERNPDNFFAQVEQAAFCPANLVPGITFSDDKMLTGRIFSYRDTQRHRVGANFAQLPVNRPLTPAANHQQDGPMAFDYAKSSVNYFPSAQQPLPRPEGAPSAPGPLIQGRAVRQPIQKTDDFAQAGVLYRSFSPEQRQHLAENLAAELVLCPRETRERVMEFFAKADPEYGAAVQNAVAALE